MLEEAVQYFANVVKARPKNSNGWLELIKCLYHVRYYEEGLEYVQHALLLTNAKPIFIFYKCAFLLALANPRKPCYSWKPAWRRTPGL